MMNESTTMQPPVAPIRTSAVADLGVLKMRISTNLEDFAAYSYFPRLLPADTPADYEVTCIDLDRDAVAEDRLANFIDPTTRAARFRSGSYLAHYFGSPAYLMTSGRNFTVYGRALEKAVWPYFVKHVLTLFSADEGMLHLKGAAFVHHGAATLLVGRNGGGKTVFLSQACASGATFLTNTHFLWRDGIGYGVPSSIRVRANSLPPGAVAMAGLPRHIMAGEFLVDPLRLFGPPGPASAPVRNVVIVDYRPPTTSRLQEISAWEAEMCLDQFSFGITTYGLQDDLFVHYDGDFGAYVRTIGNMRRSLSEFTRSVRCYHANVDMFDEALRDRVLTALS